MEFHNVTGEQLLMQLREENARMRAQMEEMNKRMTNWDPQLKAERDSSMYDVGSSFLTVTSDKKVTELTLLSNAMLIQAEAYK